MRWRGVLARAAVWVAVLAGWELAWRVIGWREWVFPAPGHVIDALLRMCGLASGFGEPLRAGWPWVGGGAIPPGVGNELVGAVWVSVLRLAAGFGISVAGGVVLGAGMWASRWLERLLGPLLLGLQTLPSVCWVPVAVLTVGLEERAVLLVTVAGSVFAAAIAVRDGLATIPPVYGRAGRMLGAGGVGLVWHVLLPASLPALAGGARQAFGFAWRSLLGAELVLTATRRHGLGHALNTGRETADIAKVVAVMVVMVVLGMAADRLVFQRVTEGLKARWGLGTT